MIQKLFIKIYVKIKTFIYLKLLSTAKIIGKGYRINTPTQIVGSGKIEMNYATIGVFPSPGLIDTTSYIEARSSSSSIFIDKGTVINNNSKIIAEREKIVIGKNCRIGFGFYVADSDFHSIDIKSRNSGLHSCKPVTIGDDVFIGMDVKIMKGVNIGNGSVIGAGSIVTRDVGINEVWCGVPSKFISTTDHD